MLFGSLSENNGGLSLNKFTASNSEMIIYHANRLFSDISGKFPEARFSAIRRSDWLTIEWKMPSHGFRSYDVKYVTSNPHADVTQCNFEVLNRDIHFESTKNYRKSRCKSMK